MRFCNCNDFVLCTDQPNCKRDAANAFKLRVHTEKALLDEQRGKLEHFMLQPEFVALPRAEKDRLYRQSVAMEQYSQVLFERLEADFQ